MGEVLEDGCFQAADISIVGLEVMAMEVLMQCCSDGGLVVVYHPEDLLELPFAPGEGFSQAGSEGEGQGCVGD